MGSSPIYTTNPKNKSYEGTSSNHIANGIVLFAIYLKSEEMKQTAVEWLMQQLPTIDKYDPYYQNLFTKAKEMEKEQIIDAWDNGIQWEGDSSIKNSEEYYNKTFKSEEDENI